MTIDYLLIGHMTADLVREETRVVGGTVAYAAPTARAFGLSVGVVTSAAPHEPLLDHLRAFACVHAIESSATTTYTNQYEGNYRIQYVRAVAGDIRLGDVPQAWRDAPLVHLAPIAGEAYHADLLDAFSRAKILVTPQGWMRRWADDGRVYHHMLRDPAVIGRADVVVVSEEDIERSSESESWFAAHVPRLVVTRAERGGTYYLDSVPHTYDAVAVTPVDPTGAGDVFAASLLCAWHQLNDFHRAIRVAARLAADSVLRRGSADSAPAPHTVQAILAMR